MLSIKYIIQKTYIGTASGGEKPAWNVIDLRDGFIVDTFSLKRDARIWIQKQTTINV
jgi:hypothetical protein